MVLENLVDKYDSYSPNKRKELISEQTILNEKFYNHEKVDIKATQDDYNYSLLLLNKGDIVLIKYLNWYADNHPEFVDEKEIKTAYNNALDSLLDTSVEMIPQGKHPDVHIRTAFATLFKLDDRIDNYPYEDKVDKIREVYTKISEKV